MISFHEINLIIQTFWTSLVLASMWFRQKRNYLAHEITMMIVVGAAFVTFSSVLLTSPLGSGSTQIYFNSPFHLAVFSSHTVLAIVGIAFGTWLVALWRPKSTTFAAKSKRIAQLTAITWVIAYVAGILAFVVFQTSFLG